MRTGDQVFWTAVNQSCPQGVPDDAGVGGSLDKMLEVVVALEYGEYDLCTVQQNITGALPVLHSHIRVSVIHMPPALPSPPVHPPSSPPGTSYTARNGAPPARASRAQPPAPLAPPPRA